MPELPEVETMRRGILSIQGATIKRAQRTPCAKRPISIEPRIDALNRRVSGQRIKSVDRLGKRVVLRLQNDERLIFEPRMTGLVLIGDPPGDEHLRFSLELKKCKEPRLLFWDRRGLGKIQLMSPSEYQKKLEDGSLGPDALEVDEDELKNRFGKTTREIKPALLDQSKIAGVGNLYASEILFLAGVSPKRRCHKLTKRQWSLIHHHMIEVLNTAIEYEGSTLSDGTYRTALNDPGSYQNQHRVYDREGKPCPNCDESIKRIVQAQRSTFYCTKCQK